MIVTLHRTVENQPNPDGKHQAFLDWLILGVHTGYRRCEWAAPKAVRTPSDFPTVPIAGKPIYQCIGTDFQLYDQQGQLVPPSRTVADSNLRSVTITIRWQKNKNHGEKLSFAANHLDPRFCPVRAIRRIQLRARRLGVPDHHPPSCFLAHRKSKQPTWFHSTLIKNLLQAVAMKTYHLSSTAELKANGLIYSSHSIRVGATVILHSAGASEPELKMRIRWKSDSFLMYLRNTPQDAANHARRMNASDSDNWSLAQPFANLRLTDTTDTARRAPTIAQPTTQLINFDYGHE